MMPIIRFSIGVLALLGLAGAALAGGDYQPGKWEFTVEMPDMQWPSGVVLPSGYRARPGGGVLVVHTQCMKDDDLVPRFRKARAARSIRIARSTRSNAVAPRCSGRRFAPSRRARR